MSGLDDIQIKELDEHCLLQEAEGKLRIAVLIQVDPSIRHRWEEIGIAAMQRAAAVKHKIHCEEFGK